MALVFSPGALADIFGQQLNSISVIPIDVTISESHEYRTTITSKPIEDGSSVNDAAIIENELLTMSGIWIDERDSGISSLDKLESLQEIRRAREPFSVVTTIKTYESMMFESITINRDVSTAGALFFDAKLSQVRIIASETKQVPVRATKNPRKQAPKQTKGKTQPQTQTADQAAKTNKSILASQYDKFTSAP